MKCIVVDGNIVHHVVSWLKLKKLIVDIVIECSGQEQGKKAHLLNIMCLCLSMIE